MLFNQADVQERGICHLRLHPYFDYFQLSAIEDRVDTSSDTFYIRGYGTPSADCRIEERAGVLGKLPLTAGGFADDFEYSGHPSATPPPGGSTGWWGSLSFFFWEIFILEPKLWGTGHFGTGNRGTGNRFPGTIRGEPGNRFPGTGSLVPVWFPLWFPVTGYWVLGTGYWVLGTGYWVLGT